MFETFKKNLKERLDDDYYRRNIIESVLSLIAAMIFVAIGLSGILKTGTTFLHVLSWITLLLGVNQLFGVCYQNHRLFKSEDD